MQNSNDQKSPRKNWNQKETVFLIQAWLGVSQEATIGTNQSGDTFWLKISKEFNNLRAEDPDCSTERLGKACKNRWGAVKHNVSKFQGHYEALKRNVKSGWNDQMYIDEAVKSWSELPESKEKPFNLLYAWNLLKDSPKWNLSDEVPILEQSSRSTNLENTDETPEKIHLKRPQGNKAAKKEQRKRHQVGAIDENAFAKQVKLNQQFVASSSRKVQVMEEQMAIEFFSLQPNSPESIQFFNARKKSMLARALSMSANPSEPDAEIPDSSSDDEVEIV